jgi:hypothetical protein
MGTGEGSEHLDADEGDIPRLLYVAKKQMNLATLH